MNNSDKSTIPYGITESAWQSALENPSRIVTIEVGESRVWLKKITPAEGDFGRRLLTKFSKYLDLPMLSAVHQPGGCEALATEAGRLQQLHAAGINVPRLLWQSDEMILMSDLGRRFTNYLKQHRDNPELKIAAIRQAFKALNNLHGRGQYLSQAFARNITVIENEEGLEIGFIDFEDDPLATMSLENAQARDLLLLVYSLSKYIDNCQQQYQSLVSAQIEPLADDIKLQLKQFVNKFGWLEKLPGKRRFGNGYWRLTMIPAVLRAGTNGHSD
ncbi:MAG: hypothetical protein IMF09_05330 [Proteobacteria bacterium]|nr:hypothetical protein [Pseudomonadota bacterium]